MFSNPALLIVSENCRTNNTHASGEHLMRLFRSITLLHVVQSFETKVVASACFLKGSLCDRFHMPSDRF